jgi:hypothetical protein
MKIPNKLYAGTNLCNSCVRLKSNKCKTSSEAEVTTAYVEKSDNNFYPHSECNNYTLYYT